MNFLVLLFLMVQAWSRAEMSIADQEQSSVPIPTNVTITTYDMNPVVHWDFQIMPQTPVFTVQVKNYNKDLWIDACTNISHHYCEISEQVHDLSIPFWVRVKARVGQKESVYAESKEITLCREGKIEPPKLDVRRKENQIIIDIFHPLIIIKGKWVTLYDGENPCYLFEYFVHVKINRSENIHIERVQMEDDCNETLCQWSIPVSSLDSEYCFLAEISNTWGFTTEKSKEVCIPIFNNTKMDFVWIPIIAGITLLLIVITLCVYFHVKKNPFKNKSTMLPKSLLSVVRNATSETKPEPKYVSYITSYQPFVLENETVVCEEPLSPVTIPGIQTDGKPGNVESRKEPSSETQVVTTEENISDLALSRPISPIKRENSLHSSSNQSAPCSVTLSSYHSRNGSDSGLVGSNGSGFVSESEFPPSDTAEIKTEGQTSTMLRNTLTSFGYDKPHVIVDLIVDDDCKESLIGYRLTTDCKDCS